MKNPFYAVKKIFVDLKLKYKFFIINIFVICCMLVGILIGVRYVFQTYNNLLYKQTAHTLNYAAGAIEDDLKEIQQLSEYVMSDSTVQDLLTKSIESDRYSLEQSDYNRSIATALGNYSTVGRQVLSIAIYSEKYDFISGMENTKLQPDTIGMLKEIAYQPSKNSSWLFLDDTHDAIYLVRSIRKIQNVSLKDLGLLVIKVNFKAIVNNSILRTGGTFDEKDDYLMIVSGGDVVYSTDKAASTNLNLRNLKDSGFVIMEIDGRKTFLVSQSMPLMNWKYVRLIPFESIYESIDFVILRMVIIIGFFVFLGCIVSAFMINSITSHLNKLVIKMRRFQSADLTNPDVGYDYTGRRDEIGYAHNTFDAMTVKISDLVKDNYTQQLLIKDSQFQALQAQINPHFLYNTLESINWLAKSNHQEKICVMVQSLAVLLRSNINTTRNVVSLQEELSIVDSYIAIQKIRYGERLAFFIDISPILYDIQIPKMTLQPLVENSIHHALENMIDTCKIEVHAYADDTTVNIEVVDNGPGFQNPVSREKHGSGLSVGLANIGSRIQLAFGEPYGIEIRKPEKGACVHITLPKQVGMNMNSSDR